MTRDLSRLLRPRSIALIGGSWAANAVRASDAMGFDGEVWPVHPTKTEIAGRPAYASLEALPHAPDAAFVAVNRDASVDVMAELAAMGAGGAVSFASGFAETADDERQAALVAAAGEMPMLGPNCYGVINYLDGALLWPDQHGGERVERGVAIVSQSSNIAINMTMAARGLPLAYIVCVGNQAQTGLAEIGAALAADERVTAIGFYVEGVGAPAAFQAMALAARAAGKPVIAIKAGRSQAAQAAAVTHTASLAGSDAASRAFFARCGAPLLDTIPEFLETLKLLHVLGPLTGRAICSVSCSGGEASIMADAAEGRDLRYPPFPAENAARVKDALSELVTVANPLDYHTFIWGDEARMTACFSAVMETGFDLTLFVLDFPRADRCDPGAWAPTVAAIKATAARTGRRAAVVASLPENLPENAARDFAEAGVAPLHGIAEAMAAAEAAASCGDALPEALLSPAFDRSTAPARLLDEAEGKALLAAAGLAAPQGRVAATADQAATIARELGGPVALKRLGVAHKTEAGAVALSLAPEDVAGAARVMGDGPYLVEKMVEGGVGEMIIGAGLDPAYGLTITIGTGGVAAELLRDTVTLLPPVDEAAAKAAILSLRLSPLLTGYRGRPTADIDAAARAVAAISHFADAHAESLEELDVNPLIVTQNGAWAADALIRMRSPAKAEAAPLEALTGAQP